MKKFLRPLLLSWLWWGARRKIKTDNPYIVAINGSVGKTSAKEAIALVLAGSNRPVLKTPGNLNTDLGIPLALFGFQDAPDGVLEWLSALLLALFPPALKNTTKERPYYVLEFATDKPGDIAFLNERIKSDVAVLTTIAATHMAFYPDLEALVKEETSLLAGLKPGGYAVLNADDPHQQSGVYLDGKTVYYGVGKDHRKAGSVAHAIHLTPDGLACTVNNRSSTFMDTVGRHQPQHFQIQTQVLGKHQLYALAAAATLGFQEGIPTDYIAKALADYQVPPGRGRLLDGIKDTTIIDDTYNSSPEAVKASLAMLKTLAQGKRVVAVLGTMNELGDMAESAHREVAEAAVGMVDFLVVVGQYSQQMLETALKAGISRMRIMAFATPEDLISKAEQLIQNNDLIFIKGSQNGVRLERLVKTLMAHPEEANKVLVRQSHSWSAKL